MASSITLACADYARLMPLATGAVQPDRIDLKLQLGQNGSWPQRAEILTRSLSDPSIDGGEASMARHLLRIEEGDRRFVALPVFPLRNLTARDIYVRKDGPVATAADLAGKRAGMYSWSASGSIWYRHLLRFLGVDPASLTWWIGQIDTPEWSSVSTGLPDYVHSPAPGRTLADMLIEGEIDALFSPPVPLRYDRKQGPIVRLFPDFRSVEHDYVRAFGIWPPQHLVVLRQERWRSNPALAHQITDAFVRNNAMYETMLRNFPYASPWMQADLEDSDALFGPGAHADGMEANRAAVDLFCAEAHRAGLTKRRVSVEEYFQEYLSS